jgi:acetyltransferase-like isoleucine patch superfamily enzyme
MDELTEYLMSMAEDGFWDQILGGTGEETGDRHPKVRRGVLIGAGAKILGNIEIGMGAKVGAGSVVPRDVPPHSTVAGIPARGGAMHRCRACTGNGLNFPIRIGGRWGYLIQGQARG